MSRQSLRPVLESAKGALVLLYPVLRQSLPADFAAAPYDVDLWVYAPNDDAPSASMTALIGELTTLSDRIHVRAFARPPVVEFSGMPQPIEGPIVAIGETGRSPLGIRFLGTVSGLEISSLIGAMLDVAHGPVAGSGGSGPASVQRKVHIQVFSTPT